MDGTTYRGVTWTDKRLPPLINRIDQACAIFFARTGEIPNVILLREPDLSEAEDTYRVPLPNGKTATLTVEAAPFPGPSRDMLVGRKEVLQP